MFKTGVIGILNCGLLLMELRNAWRRSVTVTIDPVHAPTAQTQATTLNSASARFTPPTGSS